MRGSDPKDDIHLGALRVNKRGGLLEVNEYLLSMPHGNAFKDFTKMHLVGVILLKCCNEINKQYYQTTVVFEVTRCYLYTRMRKAQGMPSMSKYVVQLIVGIIFVDVYLLAY